MFKLPAATATGRHGRGLCRKARELPPRPPQFARLVVRRPREFRPAGRRASLNESISEIMMDLIVIFFVYKYMYYCVWVGEFVFCLCDFVVVCGLLWTRRRIEDS